MKENIIKVVALMMAMAAITGCFITWPPIPPVIPTTTTTTIPITPIPNPVISFDHVIGMGNFVGLEPWFNPPNGIGNDAPKDIPTLINQFALAGGTLIQVQLLYEDGAVFVKGKGLQLDAAKVDYCINYRNTCSNNGVCVTFVLFDHCTLKNSTRWAMSPLNSANGGPFGGAMDVYSNYAKVAPYVTDIVKKLDGNNVVWEIINEGTDSNFAGQVRDLLKSLGVTRITTSGANPGSLWRYSEHNKVTASAVKSGQLPNTDGTTWTIDNVAPICAAIRSTVGGGLVFDGATDAKHNWAEFLKNIKNPNPTPNPTPNPSPSGSLWPNEVPIDVKSDTGPEMSGVSFYGCETRFLANDSSGHGYNIKNPVGNYSCIQNADGSYTVAGKDFVGATGTHFRYIGCRAAKSTSTMFTGYSSVIPASAWKNGGNTLRLYWQSVGAKSFIRKLIFWK